MRNSIEDLDGLINELKINLPKKVDEVVSCGRTSVVSKALNIRAGLLVAGCKCIFCFFRQPALKLA